jgi:hypothetical protein
MNQRSEPRKEIAHMNAHTKKHHEIFWRNRLAASELFSKGYLKQGTKVISNGFEGVIVRHYDGNMYEIRLPGGLVCTDDFHLIGER